MAFSHHFFSPPRVAILIEQNFEELTFQIPYQALEQVGGEIFILGDRKHQNYQGKQGKVSLQPNQKIAEVQPDSFDAIILPSFGKGERFHSNINTINFVCRALSLGKLVAAISQGVQILIDGDLLKCRNATGLPLIEKDIIKAGGTYLDEPLVIDGNLITAQQTSDLALFTTAILSRLRLQLPEEITPNQTEWWQLAEAWGGSSKDEIIDTLSTALVGEVYTQKAFEQYSEKANDSNVRSLLEEIVQTKQQHIQMLQSRLHHLGKQDELPTAIADHLVQLDTAFIPFEDNAILNFALSDIQTAVVEVYSLRLHQTDPDSTAIFTEIEQNLRQYEQRLGKLYRDRLYLQGISLKKGKPSSIFNYL